MIVYPLLLIVLMLVRPQGIFGAKEFGFGTVRGLLSRRGKGGASAGPA